MTTELRRYEPVIQRLLPSLLLHGWKCRGEGSPVPGDLVMLQSAPQSEWHLSIYRQAGAGEDFEQRHLLESLKTGKHCWWENVGFHVIDRKKCAIGREAEWDDAQFEFNDKFRKVYRKADFYIPIPFIDRFDGEAVVFKFRTRYGINDKRTELQPFLWRKATQKALLAFLLDGERLHKADSPQEASDA
ncbi:hypothetical protein [Stenotrophomonas sp.]|uniref:hypothetical protein n=1 Tax=Stenotrophomonas sp. TaxID=69392 RepID=UPI0028B03251|nr:hypothetical protein [Stenotrophomonas sp.]